MKAIMFGYNGNVDMNQFDFDLCFLQRYSKNHLNKLKYQNHNIYWPVPNSCFGTWC